MKEVFNVTGMSCAACSARVEKAVSHVQGVQSVTVNLLKNSMSVEFSPEATSEGKIIQAVIDAGYGASAKNENVKSTPAGENAKEEEANKQTAIMKRRLTWSIVFCALLMWVAMAPMVGIQKPLGSEFLASPAANALTQLLLTIPVIYLNFVFFVSGFKALVNRSPNMDSLVCLGATASMVFGIFALYQIIFGLTYNQPELVHHYSHNLYFDSASMILTLILVGKYFESRAKGKTTAAISKLLGLVPKTARVEKDGQELEIPIEELLPQNILVLKTGERVPADATVISGRAAIDESSLTGEPIPTEKEEGSTISTGTLLVNGFIKARVDKVGKDTVLSQIIALVDDATSTKPPVAKLADKVSGIFVPVVITIAVIAALTWWLLGKDWEFAVMIGVAVLVISCPCALGLATPTAIMVGMGKGAENGILFKSAESIELTEKIDTVVLDKTGTVTLGSPKVTDFELLGNFHKKRLYDYAYSLEKLSQHPLAAAITERALAKGAQDLHAEQFEQTPKSIKGIVDGKAIEIGSIHLLKEKTPIIDKLTDAGKTPLIMTIDGIPAAIFGISDPIKSDSAQAVEGFKKLGIDVWMLTGDNPKTAQAVASQVGIEHVISEVLPADKERIVRELQAKGHKVMMVGDGINDSPSLARADVGCAIGNGTDIAIESASVVLMKSHLSDAVNTVYLSKSVMKNIRENLFWAFFYNSVGIPVAAGVFYSFFGWVLSPMIAAAAMSCSSVSVVSNALRLKGWKTPLIPTKDQEVSQLESPSCQPAETQTENKNVSENQITEKETNSMSKEIQLSIEGMMCGHCTGRVTKALEAIPGAAHVEVTLNPGKAIIKGSNELSKEAAEKAVVDAGYTVTESKEVGADSNNQPVVLSVNGMMCHHCTGTVKKVLEAIPGVSAVEVSLEDKTASFKLEEPATIEQCKEAITKAGYEVL